MNMNYEPVFILIVFIGFNTNSLTHYNLNFKRNHWFKTIYLNHIFTSPILGQVEKQ